MKMKDIKSGAGTPKVRAIDELFDQLLDWVQGGQKCQC